MKEPQQYTLGELAELIGADLDGDPACEVRGLATLATAGPGQVAFFANPAYRAQLESCWASAVILSAEHGAAVSTNRLLSANPYLSFARATALFASQEGGDNRPPLEGGQARQGRSPKLSGGGRAHETATIAEDAEIGKDAVIGPQAVLEPGTRIGEGARIGAGCYIGSGSSVGAGSLLYPNVTLYHGVTVGQRAIIHSGAVIGGDGFGFASDRGKSIKVHQLGGVRIGDDVEIGACSSIDRGALDDTVIGDGVKLDSQVQVGHNCRIGDHSILCGCSGLAGSVTLGEYCIIGGGAGVVGHINLPPRTQVAAMTLLGGPVTEADRYASGTGHMKAALWKRNVVRFRQLDDMAKRLQRLERALFEDPGRDKIQNDPSE